MYRNLLSTLKESLWTICVSALLIAVGLFFHWFYVLAAGVIVAITTIIFIVEELKHGDDTAFIAIGFLLTVVFGIVDFFTMEKDIFLRMDTNSISIRIALP